MSPRRIRLSALSRRTPPSLDGNGSASLPRLRERPVLPRRPGRRRFESLRSPLPAAGIALVLIALLGYLAVYRAASNRTQVLVATRMLPAGTVLGASDLRTASIAAQAGLLGTLLPASQEPQVLEQRLVTAVPAGAPVPAGALAGRQSQATAAFTLSVSEFDVIGESLQPGDRVSVLATFGAGSGAATTRPLARDLEVLTVGEAPANSDPSTATVPVTVALVNASIVSQLALANQDGKLDLLREGAGSSTGAIPPANPPAGGGGGVP